MPKRFMGQSWTILPSAAVNRLPKCRHFTTSKLTTATESDIMTGELVSFLTMHTSIGHCHLSDHINVTCQIAHSGPLLEF